MALLTLAHVIQLYGRNNAQHNQAQTLGLVASGRYCWAHRIGGAALGHRYQRVVFGMDDSS